MCILNLLVLVLILIDWSHYFWVGELCTISQGVSLHWLISALWSVAVALHDTTRFRTGFILSIHVAWGCAIRMWSDWSCAQKHSVLTLCWRKCGVTDPVHRSTPCWRFAGVWLVAVACHLCLQRPLGWGSDSVLLSHIPQSLSGIYVHGARYFTGFVLRWCVWCISYTLLCRCTERLPVV